MVADSSIDETPPFLVEVREAVRKVKCIKAAGSVILKLRGEAMTWGCI